MARQVIEQFYDDIDGTEGAITVKFSLEGKSYEIDLSDKNRNKRAQALEPSIAAGRKTGTTRSSSPRGKSDAAAIRVWAAENNIPVPSRGRMPAAIVEQYNNR